MEPLTLAQIRNKYLDFFKSKEHLILKSAPLIPQGNKTLLFTIAGMVPFIPYFKGEENPPSRRIATCQKCLRTNDIDNVGITSRHCTFFEMLGNFSFGDYFKEEMIPWSWEFLTKELEIPEDRLYVSVYEDDDESYDIWIKNGIAAEKIYKLGKDDNFWEVGTGPCGPCSEIYYDRGAEYGCNKPGCAVGCDCDRFIEVWNLVFTQFDNDGNGNYSRLAKPNIDTGMGLERIASVIQNVKSVFEIDSTKAIMDKLTKITGIKYTSSGNKSDVSLRIITDHIRSATFLISDGVLPSNEGRGYVLRRILRRAARHGKLLGIESTFLSDLCDVVINSNGQAYPELYDRSDFIKKTISVEESRFKQTLDSGLALLEKMMESVLVNKHHILSGDDVFKLYDTFGFPVDLTKELTHERGIDIDEDNFALLMKMQRQKARDARSEMQSSDFSDSVHELLDKSIITEFNGYEKTSCESEIIAIISENELQSVISGGNAILVLDKTPFYAEGGGQVGDTGYIKTKTGEFYISDTKKLNNKTIHIGYIEKGEISLGSAYAEVNETRRTDIMRNHSSVHLLQSALRSVLGIHVQQAGSYVDDKRARFDFTHFQALTKNEIIEIEHIVNQHILECTAVTAENMHIDEANKSGAIALFGEKYGDIVRVVKMGGVSTELCGGTHVDNTGKIGMFKIVSESSVASGVRRIEATTGTNTLNAVNTMLAAISAVQQVFKANTIDELGKRAETMINDFKSTKKLLEHANIAAALNKIADSLSKSQSVNGLRIVSEKFEDIPVESLRMATDNLLNANPDVVSVFATVTDGKIMFVAGCGKTALEKGANAGKLLSLVSPIVGGGGGGRPDRASSGGRDTEKLGEAFDAVEGIVITQTGG